MREPAPSREHTERMLPVFGVEVEREPRTITIHELELLEFDSPVASIRVRCSKGTYVRSLAEDVGRALGCGAHVARLRRTRAGPFGLDDSVALSTLEALKANGQLAEMDALLQPADAALNGLPLVQLSESGGFYMRQGQPVLVPNAPCDGMVRIALETGEFLGVGEILDDGRVAPRRLIVTGR
mgnify:CR=1 FL=1